MKATMVSVRLWIYLCALKYMNNRHGGITTQCKTSSSLDDKGRAIRFRRQTINQSNRRRMAQNRRWLPPSMIQPWFLPSARCQAIFLSMVYVPCGWWLTQARTCSLMIDCVQHMVHSLGKGGRPANHSGWCVSLASRSRGWELHTDVDDCPLSPS